MSLIATRKSEQNSAAIDPWTVVHFGTGLAAGLLRAPFGPSMAVATGYEVFEHAFESSELGQKVFGSLSGPETPANVAVDLIVFGVGWWLGDKWNKT